MAPFASIRLHFHDSIQGCYASVLLDRSAIGTSEQQVPPNHAATTRAPAMPCCVLCFAL